jgi:hypothetical protein
MHIMEGVMAMVSGMVGCWPALSDILCLSTEKILAADREASSLVGVNRSLS